MSRHTCSLSTAHCRLFPAAVFALTLFACLVVPCALAQTPEPLSIFRNYFVTGDYVVGGVGLQGLGVNGFATGTINIPDQVQPNAQPVPAGADIVAAFLYWQTVESAKYPLAGQNGWFNGFPIAGTQLPSASQAPVSWSTGGCSGGANGSKNLNTYRADVRPYLNFDALGRVTGNGSYVVTLRDSGSNGGGVPLTLGATLVIIYRVLSPTVPLKSIVIYDGDFAPVNQGSTMTQDISGFYDVADSPISEITQIVGNGQPNKLETATLNGANLASLYGSLPPFPGKYNGSWDNPTWAAPANAVPPGGMTGNTNPVTTSVVPNSSNSGCVVWGAIIFGTTVRDSDNDGLLDSWEKNQGYTDVLTNRYVPLPGADPNTKDVFVDLDYLTNLGASAISGTYVHSHLPKQLAIDNVGAAFAGAPVDMDPATGKYKGVHVHFDLGGDANAKQIYPGDPYVLPDNASNAIPESTLLCQNSATLCEFPNQVAVGWKTGLLYVEDAAVSPGTSTTPPVGYFDPARKDSYHYVLFGHALGLPLSWWTTFGATTNNPTVAQLTSISVSNNSAKITLQTPASCAGAMPSPCYVYPGAQPAPGSPGYGDTNLDRITIADAINFPALNGTYIYSNPNSSTSNYVTTTTFTITTSGVPDGTYTFANEPRLAVLYAGPSSSSGHSDIGGADSLITFGLWPADDNPGCQPDPAAVPAGQNNYCDNQVGNVQAQAGTLMHELGHSFTLTHGGTYAPQNYPATPLAYGVNCKPNYQSVMNYLFQVRGFPEGSPIDYSRQSLQNLYEDTLSELTGIGVASDGTSALHATRWFAPPNSFDLKLGNRTATMNCDGSPLIYGQAGEVRVDNGPGYAGMIAAGTKITNSSPIDWNNDFMTPDPVTFSIDVNLDGALESASSSPNPPSPMVGFNDWQNIDFRQIGARAGGAGYSGGVGLTGGGGVGLTGGGGVGLTGGGGTPSDLAGGNGVGLTGGGGVGLTGGGGVGLTGGGGVGLTGGGGEVDFDLANSTVDPATGLTAAMGNKAVVLNWNAPRFGQIRTYQVYRLVGLFDPNSSDRTYNPLTNAQLIATLKGSPPLTTYTDSTVKNKTTYTYFVVAALGDGLQSNISNGAVITVVF